MNKANFSNFRFSTWRYHKISPPTKKTTATKHTWTCDFHKSAQKMNRYFAETKDIDEWQHKEVLDFSEFFFLHKLNKKSFFIFLLCVFQSFGSIMTLWLFATCHLDIEHWFSFHFFFISSRHQLLLLSFALFWIDFFISMFTATIFLSLFSCPKKNVYILIKLKSECIEYYANKYHAFAYVTQLFCFIPFDDLFVGW